MRWPAARQLAASGWSSARETIFGLCDVVNDVYLSAANNAPGAKAPKLLRTYAALKGRSSTVLHRVRFHGASTAALPRRVRRRFHAA